MFKIIFQSLVNNKLGFPTKFSLNEICENGEWLLSKIFANFDVFSISFSRTFSTFVKYQKCFSIFIEHFIPFRIKKNDCLRPLFLVNKTFKRVLWNFVCLFENILPCANILGVPNFMTRMIAIYLNLIYNAIMYSMTEYFSCIYWGQRINLQ